MRSFLKPTKRKIVLTIIFSLVSYLAADYWSSNCFMDRDYAWCPYVAPIAAWVLMVTWTVGLLPALVPYLRDNSSEVFIRSWFIFAYLVGYLSIYVIVCGLDWLWSKIRKVRK